MKLTVEKDAFLEKLSLVVGIAEKRTAMPILSTLLITASNQDKTIRLTATDLETTVSTWTDAEVEKDFSIAVPAHKLFEFVSKISDGTVKIEKIDKSRLKVTTANGDCKISGLPADEYPEVADISFDGLFDIDPSLLDDMISKTIYSVSSDSIRRNLTGICFEKIGQNNLRLVATDGHRLSLVEHTLQKDIKLDTFIVPKKGLLELRKILKSSVSDQDDLIKIGCEGNFFVVAGKGTILFSRLIEAEFPDYKQVIPDKSEFEAEIDREPFVGSLERVGVFSSEQTRNVKTNFDDNVLTLTSSSHEFGEAKESININYSKEKKEIGFSGTYLMDAVKSFDQDKLLFSFTDEASPVLLKPKEKNNHLCVIMPMRI